jgi:organic radical activating enzyme
MNLFNWFKPKDPVKKYFYFKEEKMDPISPTFCGAKWFESTMWLYQGTTASCHHNPFHKIQLDANNPGSLHNTPVKIKERTDMLAGGKPDNCSYCWNAEANGTLSDRVIKTNSVPTKIFKHWFKNKPLVVTPTLLEIAFERTCNLACAYCGPSFSSKWANDIKRQGPYVDLITDSRYSTDSGNDIIDNAHNPYTESFFKWWPSIERDLNCLRITGGEPLMSPNFWRCLDMFKKFNGTLIVNTNLICYKDELRSLLDKTRKVELRIHTSMESNLDQAEYVRDGFDKTIWLANVHFILQHRRIMLNVTTAINNMAVWSFIDYLKLMGELKTKYGKKRIEINCNFVHYPAFMRVQMIPTEQRKILANEVDEWYILNKKLLNDKEQQHILRFISTMDAGWIDQDYEIKDAYMDLKSFITQYDTRRGKNFKHALDKRFVEWYNGL